RRSWMGGALIGRDANEVAEKGGWMQSFLGALSDVPPAAASEELRRRGWIVGTPDQAASQLGAWSALGIERVMFQWYNLDDLDGRQRAGNEGGGPRRHVGALAGVLCGAAVDPSEWGQLDPFRREAGPRRAAKDPGLEEEHEGEDGGRDGGRGEQHHDRPDEG